VNILLVVGFPDPRHDPDFYDGDGMSIREAVRGVCIACQHSEHQLVIVPHPALGPFVNIVLGEDPFLVASPDSILEFPDPRVAVFIGGMQAEIDTFRRLRAAGIRCYPIPTTGIAATTMFAEGKGDFSIVTQRVLQAQRSYAVLFTGLLSN
jgi:hypothetical protein